MEMKLSAAGINILVKSDFDINISGESAGFLRTFEKPDCILAYREAEEKDFSVRERGRYTDGRIYCRNGDEETVYLIAYPGEEPYGKVTVVSDDPFTMECRYLKGSEKHINYLKNIYTAFGLETILLHYEALIMHASVIRWNETGILFSASSGVGKSTQASLWERYENAEVINGDRAGIRKTENGWTAYGLPLAGSSGIYRNESVPLKCIVLLEQAEENSVRSVSAAEAYRFLYPEVMMHRWDPASEEKASSLLLEMIREIKVVRLSCLPDRGAVEMIKNLLLEEG